MVILEITSVPFTERFRGGGESYPFRLAEELSRYEEVTSCFSIPPGSPEPEGKFRIVPATFIELPPVFRVENPLPTIGSLMVLNRTLESLEDLEFVHVHNLRTAMSTAWLLLAQLKKSRRGFKVLLTDHGARWFPLPHVTAKAVDYLIPVSDESLRLLGQYTSRPSFVVPPGVPARYPGLTRAVRSWDERDIDLIFFGRICTLEET